MLNIELSDDEAIKLHGEIERADGVLVYECNEAIKHLYEDLDEHVKQVMARRMHEQEERKRKYLVLEKRLIDNLSLELNKLPDINTVTEFLDIGEKVSEIVEEIKSVMVDYWNAKNGY